MYKLVEHKQQKAPVRIMTSDDIQKLFDKAIDKVVKANTMFTLWYERDTITEKDLKRNPVVASFPYGRNLLERDAFELFYTIEKHTEKAATRDTSKPLSEQKHILDSKEVQKKGSKKTPSETPKKTGE